MEKTNARTLGFVFVLLGLLGVLHHLLVSGRFFDLGDVLHHEFFEAIFFTAGLVLLLTSLLNRKWLLSQKETWIYFSKEPWKNFSEKYCFQQWSII